jgi:hypothetical protein
MSFGGQTAPPVSCLKVLSSEVIQSKHSLALGPVFDDVFKSHYGEGSKILKKIFSFLNLGDANTQNPSMILQTVLFHLHLEPSFMDRFYPLNLRPAKKLLLRNVLVVLDQRLNVLNGFLKLNPLKAEGSKLYAELAYALLKDFNTTRGFLIYDHSNLIYILHQAQRKYFEAPPNTFHQEDDLIVFRQENRGYVERRMKELNTNQFPLLYNKAIYDEFSDLEILKDYHFYVLHKPKEDKKRLMVAYERALNFMLDVVVNPTQEYTAEEMKPNVASNFFYNLKNLLNGSLNERFGSDFTDEFKDQMKRHVEDLHYHMKLTPLPNALFPARSALIALNDCFSIYGLKPIVFE